MKRPKAPTPTQQRSRRAASPNGTPSTGVPAKFNRIRSNPILRRGLKEARRRFQHLEGVVGFGIGRKIHERQPARRRYGSSPKKTGGLCVTVFVEKKQESTNLTRATRIPKAIYVTLPGEKWRSRVLLDVIAAGIPAEETTDRDRIPTATRILPGRRFICGKRPVDSRMGEFERLNDFRSGTIGSVIRMGGGGDFFASSASHVFIATCEGERSRPDTDRGIGAEGRTWKRVTPPKFFPPSVEQGGRVFDAMLFQIPSDIQPDLTAQPWPLGFVGEFATTDDILEATNGDAATGFAWVERSGVNIKIPLKLVNGVTGFEITITCGDGTPSSNPIPYGFVWHLRFNSATTKSGDSGCPIFLRIGEDGSRCRLLGFHFLRSDMNAWAVDAERFLSDLAGGAPGQAFTLALVET